jgi:tetratricopeptide (TPR) repeat protein
MARPAAWIAVVFALVAAAGCRSAVEPLTQDLTPDQYFQRAIEASDKDNYSLAMKYYEAFQAKFPDDAARNIWASYEIALLHHKLGDDDKAIELFDQVLARYENQPAAALPPGPRVLAEKVKSNILKNRKPPAPAAPAAPAAPVAQPPAAQPPAAPAPNSAN